jgi:L-iditol 2-dehydrogenase
MSYEQGSFIEPLGTVVRGLRAIDIKPGDTLLILGCGIAGLLMIKLARALGAGRIIATDIYDSRLKAAKRCGAEAIIHAEGNVSEFVKDINNGRLADKVIVCTGSQPAAYQSLESVDRGGTVLLFAVPNPGQTISIDFNPFWRNDISLKTCYGAAPIDNMQAMELIRAKNVIVDDLITHRFGLEDISDGFRVASEAKDCLKIIIKPHGNATNC